MTLRKILFLFYVVMVLLVSLGICGASMKKKGFSDKPLEPVKYVDLGRYVGVWYEVARIPNRFQKRCAKNTTASYSLGEDGHIMVVNSCVTSSGEKIEARGIARVVDNITNAKLKVSFVSFAGVNLFWGDYWVVGISQDYSWAVVGTPNRRYGWILSRSPRLDKSTFIEVEAILSEKGYNPEDFERTSQVWPHDTSL